MKKMQTCLIILMLYAGLSANAQEVSIVNIQLTPFNITPESMLSATVINNTENPFQVETISKLYNQDNQLLLTVKSAPFALVAGLNTSFIGSRRATIVEYANTGQANYLKTTRGLSSGNFRICVELKVLNSEIQDEFCDELVSDINQYLYLVSPADKDSMEIKNPMLIWAHSEPFNVLSKGESFRMIVTEMKSKQSPEEAIMINIPLMTKTNLAAHNLQYPYEARGLQEGSHYAWQVQKVINGVVAAQTEVWEFSIIKKRPLEYSKYAVLKKKLDAGYYVAKNNKVFFKLDEEYLAGKLNCKIYNEKREIIQPKARNEGVKNGGYDVKNQGLNQFEVDLEQLNVSKGFYTLQVGGAKGELYLLKFYVE